MHQLFSCSALSIFRLNTLELFSHTPIAHWLLIILSKLTKPMTNVNSYYISLQISPVTQAKKAPNFRQFRICPLSWAGKIPFILMTTYLAPNVGIYTYSAQSPTEIGAIGMASGGLMSEGKGEKSLRQQQQQAGWVLWRPIGNDVRENFYLYGVNGRPLRRQFY